MLHPVDPRAVTAAIGDSANARMVYVTALTWQARRTPTLGTALAWLAPPKGARSVETAWLLALAGLADDVRAFAKVEARS